MLPTDDAEWVGAELAGGSGCRCGRFTLTATDANRWAIRLARLATGRPKILVFALLLPRLGRRGVRACPARTARPRRPGQRRAPGRRSR